MPSSHTSRSSPNCDRKLILPLLTQGLIFVVLCTITLRGNGVLNEEIRCTDSLILEDDGHDLTGESLAKNDENVAERGRCFLLYEFSRSRMGRKGGGQT